MPLIRFPGAASPGNVRGVRALLGVDAKYGTYAQDVDLSIIVFRFIEVIVDAVRWRIAAFTLQIMIHPAHQPKRVVIPAGRAPISMPFSRIQHQAHRWRVFLQLQEAVEHPGLGRVDPRVGIAVQDQNRRGSLFHVVERRRLAEQLPVLPRPFPQVHKVEFPRNIGGAERRDLVAQANVHDGSGESLRILGRTPGRGVATVGTACYPDPVAVDHALLDQVVDAVDQVVEFLHCRTAEAKLREFDAAPGGTAVVLEEREVAFARSVLRRGRVAGEPAVGIVRFRAAVHVENQWIAGAVPVVQLIHQDALDHQPVARRVADQFLPCQRHVDQPRVRIREAFGPTAADPVDLVGMGGGVAGQGHGAGAGYRQAGEYGTVFEQRFLIVAVGVDGAHANAGAFIAQEADPVVLQPAQVPDMAFQPGNQVGELPAVPASHHQATFTRVVDQIGADESQITAVGAPGHFAQLARVLDASELVTLKIDDPDPREYQRIVDQLLRRDLDRQAVACRRPGHVLDRALQRNLARIGVDILQVEDPDASVAQAFFVNDLVETLLFQFRYRFVVGLERQQRDPVPVRAERITGNVALQGCDGTRFAAVHRDRVKPGRFVVAALVQKDDATRIGVPSDPADADL